MSEKSCPSEAELLSFVDRDLTPEQLSGIERHLATCQACATQCEALQQLLQDLAAPMPGAALDVQAHIASVMKRLDTPVAPIAKSRRVLWGVGLLVAAAAALLLLFRPSSFPPKSANRVSALADAVTVSLYASEPPLRPLAPGDKLQLGSALTAGFRNPSDRPVHVLLFALDAGDHVHWIAPRDLPKGAQATESAPPPDRVEALLPKAARGDDISEALGRLAPKLSRLTTAAALIRPGAREQERTSAVVLDALMVGPLRVFALISETSSYRGEIELLPVHELNEAALRERFPRAAVRQIRLDVRAP